MPLALVYMKAERWKLINDCFYVAIHVSVRLPPNEKS
jgi:hypothetical protein